MNELATAPGQNIRPFDLTVERVDAIVKTANEWIATVPEIKDEETAQRAQTLIRQIEAEISPTKGKLTLEEKAELAPLQKEATVIKDRYLPQKALLAVCKSKLGALREAWLDREQARLDAEKARQQAEADRLIREAQEAERKALARPTVENTVAVENAKAQALIAVAAADAPVERAQVRDLYGGRAASTRVLWRAEMFDPLLTLIHYQDHPDVLDVIQKLANADATAAHKEGREIPGCRLIEKRTAA